MQLWSFQGFEFLLLQPREHIWTRTACSYRWKEAMQRRIWVWVTDAISTMTKWVIELSVYCHSLFIPFLAQQKMRWAKGYRVEVTQGKSVLHGWLKRHALLKGVHLNAVKRDHTETNTCFNNKLKHKRSGISFDMKNIQMNKCLAFPSAALK